MYHIGILYRLLVDLFCFFLTYVVTVGCMAWLLPGLENLAMARHDMALGFFSSWESAGQ